MRQGILPYWPWMHLCPLLLPCSLTQLHPVYEVLFLPINVRLTTHKNSKAAKPDTPHIMWSVGRSMLLSLYMYSSAASGQCCEIIICLFTINIWQISCVMFSLPCRCHFIYLTSSGVSELQNQMYTKTICWFKYIETLLESMWTVYVYWWKQ